MATHAQIANDMAAHASYWDRRDKYMARACRDAATLLRVFLDGGSADGRTLAGCIFRLQKLAGNRSLDRVQAVPDFDRAVAALRSVRKHAKEPSTDG